MDHEAVQTGLGQDQPHRLSPPSPGNWPTGWFAGCDGKRGPSPLLAAGQLLQVQVGIDLPVQADVISESRRNTCLGMLCCFHREGESGRLADADEWDVRTLCQVEKPGYGE